VAVFSASTGVFIERMTGQKTSPKKTWTEYRNELNYLLAIEFKGSKKNPKFSFKLSVKKSILWGGLESGVTHPHRVMQVPSTLGDATSVTGPRPGRPVMDTGPY
jgi:hypothetical protein